MSSRLIGSGLPDHPSSPESAKVVYCKSLDLSVAGLQTALLQRHHPKALQVTTHGQK